MFYLVLHSLFVFISYIEIKASLWNPKMKLGNFAQR